MKSFLVKEILKPLATRVGAVAAGLTISALGAEPEIANQIGIGITAAIFLICDLVIRQTVTK